MNKFTSTFSVLLLLSFALVSDAHALRTAHRPWLSKDPETSTARNLKSNRSVRQTAPRVKKQPTARAAHKGDQIAQQAVRYTGSRYRFGGDSKGKGFDCSGLIRRIYNDLNLTKLPHTSDRIYTMGDAVSLNELRPGDLVFFKNTYKRGISHVGVYAGDNNFVHAQNRRRGVSMTPLSDPYYQLHYAGARRLY